MPKKAAETKAAPAAEKAAAASPAAPKAEKPAAATKPAAAAPAPKEDKPTGSADGAKRQEGGGRKQDGGSGGGARRPADGPRRDGGGGGGGGQGDNNNGFKGKSDPEIDRINNNIEVIKASIKKCQDEVSAIDKQIEAKKGDKVQINSDQTGVKDKLTELKLAIEEAKKERENERDRAKELSRLRTIKIEESRKMRDAFGNNAPADASADTFLKKLDAEIKKIEELHASKSHSLAEEKKLLAEIGTKQQAKKQFKEYKILQDQIAADKDKIKLVDDLVKEKNNAVVALHAQRDALMQDNKSASDKFKTSREDMDKLYAKRAEAKAHIVEHRANQDAEWQKIRVLRDKKKEQYLKKKEENAELFKKRNEERRVRVEAAKKIQDEKEPYEEEIATCDSVLGYLRTLIKKSEAENKPASDSASDSSPAVARSNAPVGTVLKKEREDEGPLKPKKQQKKKATTGTESINHAINVFSFYEAISLSPPAKLSDVDGSITQVEAKKEHFKKLAETQVEVRRAKKEKEAKEQEEKEKADKLATAEQAAASTTSTTTTTTTEVVAAE